MSRKFPRVFLLFACLARGHAANALTVSIDTSAAKAVLHAMQDPALGRDRAMKIAEMHGNQGVIRKLKEFKIRATTQAFADALYDTAHGKKITDPVEKSFLLFLVQPKIPHLLKLIHQIEANPKAFQKVIEKRIGMFTPPGANIHLHGYVVAAGDGGGYAFGDNDFYLNVGIVDELVVAKSVTTHELYHAVQGAFAKDRALVTKARSTTASHVTESQLDCQSTERLFSDVYAEGSATYVGDVSVLAKAHSEIGVKIRNDLADGVKHIHTSISLLEMSVAALNAQDSVSFDDVYGVGFYGHGVLYDIGYVMAKDIAESDGPQGLAAFLKQPPYKFILRYTQLPKYGADADHPKLGPNTMAAEDRIANGCK